MSTGLVKGLTVQAQRIEHYGERTHGHRCSSQHGMKRRAAEGHENSGSDRNAEDVVAKGPEEVLPDVAQGGPTQADC